MDLKEVGFLTGLCESQQSLRALTFAQSDRCFV